jgi:cysteine desulfurase
MRLPSGRLYLDCNATTPLSERAAAVLAHAGREAFGNPSSAYAEGRAAREAMELARSQVAALVGCELDEVVFTGSATESDHLALTSAFRGARGRRRVLLSSIEHPAIYDQRENLEAMGVRVEEIPVTAAGVVDLEALRSGMGPDVAVVSVLAAHNETGVLQPLEEVGALCAAAGALFLTDAVQALGKVPSPWRSARPDYLAAAAHKLYGPKGVGALVVRRGAPLTPMLVGGGQEGGRRSSTEAVALASAFGEACEEASGRLSERGRVADLRDGMEARLVSEFGAVVHGAEAPRLPNTSFFSVPGALGTAVAEALDVAGVAVSTGSACHSGSAVGARVLKAMGVPADLLGSVLRVSLGRDTAERDIMDFLDRLPRALLSARGTS